MSEKSKESNGEQQQKEGGGGEGKKKESGGGKGNATVVFKVDLLHCDGCVSRVMKCIRSSEGVDEVKIGDGLITVVGKVDPAKIRERVLKKTRKKVEVVSPQANKNGDGKEKGKGKENGGGGNGNGNAKEEKKELNDKSGSKKSDVKKEPPVTTAVLKVHLHCQGCIHKIRKYVVKTKGYKDMKIDKQKETVTVTGALDMKALAEVLKKHLKREVQILPPPKKEAEKKENAGGGKGKAGGEKGKNGGGGDGKEKATGGEKMEGNKMQMQVAYPNPYPYPYPYPIVHESADQFHYNPYPYAFGPNHAPQMFSDENPNACSVM